MRKKELIDRIRTATNILDEEIPDIDSPVLSPTRYVKKKPPKQTTEQRKKEIRELEEMLGLRKTRTCGASASLSASALPEIKITDPEEVERDMKINGIKEINRGRNQFNVTQTASALRGFARQFRNLSKSFSGPRELMQIVRPEVLNLMRKNRRTRIILILNSEMMRQELFSEESEILEAHFGINPIENLESTDESSEYNTMILTI